MVGRIEARESYIQRRFRVARYQLVFEDRKGYESSFASLFVGRPASCFGLLLGNLVLWRSLDMVRQLLELVCPRRCDCSVRVIIYYGPLTIFSLGNWGLVNFE